MKINLIIRVFVHLLNFSLEIKFNNNLSEYIYKSYLLLQYYV